MRAALQAKLRRRQHVVGRNWLQPPQKNHIYIDVKPQLVVIPLACYYMLFPSLSVHLSFACRHLACLISLGIARYVFKNKANKMLNNTQNVRRL